MCNSVVGLVDSEGPAVSSDRREPGWKWRRGLDLFVELKTVRGLTGWNAETLSWRYRLPLRLKGFVCSTHELGRRVLK